MSRNDELFARARAVIPGGVDSPVRAFGAVGGTPRFYVRGEGAYVWDADGERYVDLVQSWGALLFGHARPEIVEAAVEAAARGTSFGAPTEGEVELAARLVDALPGVDRVRLVSSGTEAAMSAIRLARGTTGRDLLVKFDGCYHGHSDALLAKGGGSGLATFGIPGSPGVTEGAARDTLTAPYNDLAAVEALFAERGDAIAVVAVEPVAANMGVVPPQPGFLQGLRDLCTRHGALLLFDEVITGFRLSYGGAQTVYGVTPDLTVLGKVMGGGFPCAAFGGRQDVMGQLAPEGPVYQAGTLSGNPVAVAAGIAALDLARRFDPYPQLERTATTLIDGLTEAFASAGIPVWIGRAGSMFSVFFTDRRVTDFEGARGADHERYARFFHHLLANGVALPPSGYELWTLGTAHDEAAVASVLAAAASFAG
ncbi:MAG TPA: glutamate-1-semialdehyde 2,1-aminomutase [Actinomycetota bacterium]